MSFKGEIGAEFLDNVKTGFTVGDIYRIIDAGKLGGVDIPFGAFVEWKGTAWEVKKDMQYATSKTGESLDQAVADVLDDHATSSAKEEMTMPSAEAANYTVGNYFEQDGEIWKCTDKTDNGDGTWTVKAEEVNGVVPVLNELAGAGSKQWTRRTVSLPIAAGATGQFDVQDHEFVNLTIERSGGSAISYINLHLYGECYVCLNKNYRVSVTPYVGDSTAIAAYVNTGRPKLNTKTDKAVTLADSNIPDNYDPDSFTVTEVLTSDSNLEMDSTLPTDTYDERMLLHSLGEGTLIVIPLPHL